MRKKARFIKLSHVLGRIDCMTMHLLRKASDSSSRWKLWHLRHFEVEKKDGRLEKRAKVILFPDNQCY